MSYKERYYTQIYNDILDALIKTKVSGQEFRIILLIIRKTYGFHKNEDYIANSQMRGFTCINSKSRISVLINNLVDKNIVNRLKNVRGKTRKYSINEKYWEWEGYEGEIPENTDTKGCEKGFRKNKTRVQENHNHKRNNTKETKTKEKETDFYFDLFWDAYPKDKNKHKALREFQKINPDQHQFKKILVAVEKFKTTKQWQKDNGKYIPHAANWLKDRRYEDEIQEHEIVNNNKQPFGLKRITKKGF